MNGTEGGTPAHLLSVYDTKLASCLAGLNAHINTSVLLTVLLTVYGLGCPQKVQANRTLTQWNCYYSRLESKCQKHNFFKWQYISPSANLN